MATTFYIDTDDDVRRLEMELLSAYLSVSNMPVFMETLDRLEHLHEGYFLSETGPGGNQWAPNAPATMDRKGHGDVLQDTLDMMNAMVRTTAGGAVRDAFDEGHFSGMAYGLRDEEIPYWKYHDTPGGQLPWRPFIGITGKELDVIAGDLADNKIRGMIDAA